MTIIAKQYSDTIEHITAYTNEEYLTLQVLQLKDIFNNELSAIKNVNLEFIAFSNVFASEFNFDHSNIGQKLQSSSDFSASVCAKIHKEEYKLIANKKSGDTVFHLKIAQQHFCYLMRKRALVNPSTQDVVGLLIVAAKFDTLQHSIKIFKENLNKNLTTSIVVNDHKITEIQQMIITCLLLGFHHRKEIVEMINQVTNANVSDIQIKHALQNLYKIYSCSSTYELIDFIGSSKEYVHRVPGTSIPDKIYHMK